MVEPAGRIILPPAPATAKVSSHDLAAGERFSCSYGHWAVVLLRSGTGSLSFAGRSYRVVPGTLVCSPPGAVTVELSPYADVRVISMEERGSGLREAWRPFSVPVVRRLTPSEVASWTERIERVAQRIAAGAFGDEDVLALRAAVLERFWLASPSRGARRIVHAAFGALHRELDQIESLDALASALGYTRNYLSDLVREATGVSLGSWATGMRMARAREALVSSDAAIADVGATVGYVDPAYFSRVFRQYHGVPPQAWRIAHRPDDERRADIVVLDVPTTAVA